MGLVHADFTLKNATDVEMARRGIIKEEEVRQTTVRALVDICVVNPITISISNKTALYRHVCRQLPA